MNNVREFINLITGSTEVDSMYLSFAGGIILSVSIVVLLTTLHVYNDSKKDKS